MKINFILITILFSFFVFTHAKEYIKPIQMNEKNEIVTYNKMIENECYQTNTTSMKFVQIKGVPFLLNFENTNCTGTETFIQQPDERFIFNSYHSIASLVDVKSKNELSTIYITNVCHSFQSANVFSMKSDGFKIFDYIENYNNYDKKDNFKKNYRNHKNNNNYRNYKNKKIYNQMNKLNEHIEKNRKKENKDNNNLNVNIFENAQKLNISFQYKVEKKYLVEYQFNQLECNGNGTIKNKYRCGKEYYGYLVECSESYSYFFSFFVGFMIVFLLL